MDNLQKLEHFRTKIDDLKSTVERAKWSLEETLKKLKKEFKVSSLEEAQALLKKMRKERIEKEKSFEIGLKNFEEKWGDKLEVVK